MASNPQSGGTQTPTGKPGYSSVASQTFPTYTDNRTPASTFSGTSKQWPKDLTTVYPDYMQFQAFKYVSYGDYYTSTGASLSSGSSTTATPSSGTSSTTQTTPAPSSTSGQSGQATTAQTSGSTQAVGRPTANTRFIQGEIQEQIRLPVPSSIQFSDGPKWSTEDIGVMGTQLGAAVKGLNSGQDVASNLQTMAEGLKSSIALDAIEKMQIFGSKNAISQNIGGKILNPYTEQIFNGIDPRSFTFNWKLIPRNVDEQNAIDQLIRSFRAYSLPDYSSELNSSSTDTVDTSALSDRWLTVPSVWLIKFYSSGKEMKYIPYLKVCVCQNISVNFTPDNVWSTHNTADGPAPTAYDFSAQFQEVEIITKSDVQSGGY